MFDWFFTLLYPLEYAVAAIMVAFHTVLSGIGLPADSGWTWALSIVGLVVVIRIVLIILMSLTTFTTQRQLMTKNMPASALDNPFARQQKVLLYVLPLFFAISGVNFPIGVLVYWLTTNLWSMGQQFYVIRRMPAPGSEAEKALQARQARKRANLGGEPAVATAEEPGAQVAPVGG